MTLYENVLIVRQDVSSQQVEDLAARFSGIVSEGGGRVTKTEFWGLRTLAYKIKKNRKGHYVLMNIDAPSDAVREMERNMGLSEDVLRHMTIRVDELEEGPSAMMRSRGPRDDRGRGGDRRRDSRSSETRKRPGDETAPAKDAAAEGTPTKETSAEGAAAPDAAKPDAAKPDAAKPNAAKPDAAKGDES